MRRVFAWVSSHTLLGVPLDWPLRLVFMAGLYVVLRRRLTARWATVISIAVLAAKELFDVLAHQNLLRTRPPDWGDLADLLSELLGIAMAVGLRWLGRRRRAARHAQAGVGQ